MTVLNQANDPICSHGTHTCPGRLCSAFDPSKAHKFTADAPGSNLCVCGKDRTDDSHVCRATLTPNDLTYQCDKGEGHVEAGDPEHVAWRFSWRDR